MNKLCKTVLCAALIAVLTVAVPGSVQAATRAQTTLPSGKTDKGAYYGYLKLTADNVTSSLSTSPYSSSEEMYTEFNGFVFWGGNLQFSSPVKDSGWGSSYFSSTTHLAYQAYCNYYVDYDYIDRLDMWT